MPTYTPSDMSLASRQSSVDTQAKNDFKPVKTPEKSCEEGPRNLVPPTPVKLRHYCPTCDKGLASRQSLWQHKKKCIKLEKADSRNLIPPTPVKLNRRRDVTNIIELLKSPGQSDEDVVALIKKAIQPKGVQKPKRSYRKLKWSDLSKDFAYKVKDMVLCAKLIDENGDSFAVFLPPFVVNKLYKVIEDSTEEYVTLHLTRKEDVQVDVVENTV